jgi:photosystem II stability/assembly factor-like uncharacterized protein
VAESAQAAFFSYCREDSDFALRLAEDLKAAGASVWLDQLDIVPGQRWDRAVEDALANCPRMLVILSPASVNSTNVMDEVSFALEEKKTVIPVIYKDCTVPFRLRRVQYVDFRQDYARGLKELLKTLAPEQRAGQSTPAISTVPSQRQTDFMDADEREHAAAEERRKAAEAEQAAQRSRLEQEQRRATEQARLEDEARKAAERARLEEERKRAAEQTRLEEERRKAEEQAQREQERKQAAEQARLEEQRKQAVERVRFEQQKAAEERDREAELERQSGATDEQGRRIVQEESQRAVFWASRIFSKLPVWARIGVASCGILIVSSVLYWVSRRPSHKQTGGTSQQQFKTDATPSGEATADKGLITPTADGAANGKSPRPSNPPPVRTPSGGTATDKGIPPPVAEGGSKAKLSQQANPPSRTPLGLLGTIPSSVTPQSGWTVGDGGTVLHTEDGGRRWQKQEAGGAWDLNAVTFVTPQSGWIVGGFGTILHTEDGGRSWQKQASGTREILNAVTFVTPQSGWAVGGNDWKKGSGIILHTEDGGRSWQGQNRGTVRFNAVSFVTPQEGWVVGDQGTILGTVDGGRNWQKQDSGTTNDLSGVTFVTSRAGWAVGEDVMLKNNGTVILHTEDGGLSWQKQEGALPVPWLNAVAFVTAQSGWVVGDDPIIAKNRSVILYTYDGGRRWDEQGPDLSVGLRSVAFVTPEAGWAVGDHGTILHTVTGGAFAGWKKQDSGTTQNLRCVTFVRQQRDGR